MNLFLRIASVVGVCALCGCASSTDTAERIVKAQQAQPAAPMPAPAATSPAVAPAPAPPATVEQYYPGVNGDHWVALVQARGAQLKLEDGSLWEITPSDRQQTLFWTVAQKITVVRNASRYYPFTITNTDKHAGVEAKLLTTGAPR